MWEQHCVTYLWCEHQGTVGHWARSLREAEHLTCQGSSWDAQKEHWCVQRQDRPWVDEQGGRVCRSEELERGDSGVDLDRKQGLHTPGRLALGLRQTPTSWIPESGAGSLNISCLRPPVACQSLTTCSRPWSCWGSPQVCASVTLLLLSVNTTVTACLWYLTCSLLVQCFIGAWQIYKTAGVFHVACLYWRVIGFSQATMSASQPCSPGKHPRGPTKKPSQPH